MKDVSPEWSQRFGAATARAVHVYDEVMVPRLFEPWAHVLLDAVQVSPGDDVLDVATGPGTVARVAAARGARVTACDFSPAMLAVAESKPGDVTYVESPAAPLAVADEAFDVAVCQQGLQFFPDRHAALREMRRALRPGGRLGVAVWAPIDQSPIFEALADALGEVLGADARAGYVGGPWVLADRDAVVALVAEAGFGDVQARTERQPSTFEGGPAQLLQTVAVTALADRVAVADEGAVRAALARRLGDGPIVGLVPAHIVTAVR